MLFHRHGDGIKPERGAICQRAREPPAGLAALIQLSVQQRHLMLGAGGLVVCRWVPRVARAFCLCAGRSQICASAYEEEQLIGVHGPATHMMCCCCFQ